jgi:hypothetical protein
MSEGTGTTGRAETFRLRNPRPAIGHCKDMSLMAARSLSRALRPMPTGSLMLRAHLSKSACGSGKCSAVSTFAKRYPEFMANTSKPASSYKPIGTAAHHVAGKQPTALDKAVKLFAFTVRFLLFA